MNMGNRKTLAALLLVVLAALLVLVSQPAEAARPSGAERAPLAQEAETPTPLPTLVVEEDAPSGAAIFGVGLMVVCAMFIMLIGGIYAAVWMVSLRLRIRD